MITLIQQASTGGAAGGFLQSVILFAPLILIFYFLILRPQNQRLKKHREMVAGLQRNDVVITNGGIVGKIKKVGEEELTIVSGTAEIKIARSMVASVKNSKAAND